MLELIVFVIGTVALYLLAGVPVELVLFPVGAFALLITLCIWVNDEKEEVILPFPSCQCRKRKPWRACASLYRCDRMKAINLNRSKR